MLPPIHTVQRQKVVLDSDLARLYGVQPKRLNEAVRRNRARFPDDFCFVLTAKEFEGLSAPLAAGSREDTGVLTQVRQLDETRKRVSEEKACAEFPRYEGDVIHGGM